MGISETVEKYHVEKIEEKSKERALDRMASVILARIMLNSGSALRVTPDFDSMAATDIMLLAHEDGNIDLIPGSCLSRSLMEFEKIDALYATAGTSKEERNEFNCWMDVSSQMPPEKEFVLCVSENESSCVPIVAAMHMHEGKPRFLTNYKINGSWQAFPIDSITHWQPLPFPPKNHKKKAHEQLVKKMPFTQERKRKKKKRRK